jgi:hypothetical protein
MAEERKPAAVDEPKASWSAKQLARLHQAVQRVRDTEAYDESGQLTEEITTALVWLYEVDDAIIAEANDIAGRES